MKIILSVLFLASLSTTALASYLMPRPATIKKVSAKGELCAYAAESGALEVEHNSILTSDKRVENRGMMVFLDGEISESAREERTFECEVTMEIEYPVGYRFKPFEPRMFGSLEADTLVSLDAQMDLRIGTGTDQSQSFYKTTRGLAQGRLPEIGDFPEQQTRREMLSDCSGSAKIVMTNRVTIRPTNRDEPGEVDDVGMALLDANELSLHWERCAPGEL